MSTDDPFERQLAGLRPRLHRYCARLTGSAIDGEDVVQEALIKALGARAAAGDIGNVEGWLFRIAHNAGLDFLRARARHPLVSLADGGDPAANDTDPDVASVSFRTFLELPVLQRCTVVLKDVLGHSLEEVAEIAECSVPAAKSALQRGRQRLRELAADGGGAARLPLLSDVERRRLHTYVAAFRTGDFDSIRALLADDVRVDLVNRITLEGREKVSPYFTRYAEITHWRFGFGTVDGRAAILVYDSRGPMARPAHFILVDWRAGEIHGFRDFLFAPYVMEACDWVVLEAPAK